MSFTSNRKWVHGRRLRLQDGISNMEYFGDLVRHQISDNWFRSSHLDGKWWLFSNQMHVQFYTKSRRTNCKFSGHTACFKNCQTPAAAGVCHSLQQQQPFHTWLLLTSLLSLSLSNLDQRSVGRRDRRRKVESRFKVERRQIRHCLVFFLLPTNSLYLPPCLSILSKFDGSFIFHKNSNVQVCVCVCVLIQVDRYSGRAECACKVCHCHTLVAVHSEKCILFYKGRVAH